MNTRIYNARILTMEEDRPIFTGEIQIKDDTITYVGPVCTDCNMTWDKQIDAEGNLVMPGFKDAHTHSAMTFLRSYADDMKLDEWLNKQVFPAEAKLTGEALYWFTKLAVLEYLTSGITAAYDMYFHVDEGARAVRDTGFRYVFCDSINNFGGTVEGVEHDFLRLNQDVDQMTDLFLKIITRVRTNLDGEILEGIANKAIRTDELGFQGARVPFDDSYTETSQDGAFAVIPEVEKNKILLNQLLYSKE